MTRKEFFFVLFLAILASFLSLLPTIWSYLKTPPGFWFAGFNFLFDPWDINVYIAAIRQGFDGRWLYQSPYDPTSSPLPIHFTYLFLGHVARIFSLNLTVVYHAGSIFLTITLFLLLYFFLTFFIKEKKWRLATLCLVAFGGGIGWLTFSAKFYLVDIGVPDGTFFQILHVPHYVLNQIFFLGTLLFAFLAFSLKKWRFIFFGTLSGVILTFIHPYSLAVVIFIILGYFLMLFLARKNVTNILHLVLPQFIIWSLSLLFFYSLLRGTPFIAQIVPTPSPLVLFISYGFLIPLAFLAAVFLWQKKDEKSLFLLSWFLFHFMALYIPFSFQRLSIKGFFIILGIMAIFGLRKIGQLIKNPWPLYFWFFVLSLLTQAFITGMLILSFSASTEDRWSYLTQEEKNAFDFLAERTKAKEVVLASYRIGNFIPANTSNTVYLGHGTVFSFAKKNKDATDFFSGRFSTGGAQFLQKEKINYVFWGPEEKDLGDIDLTQEPYLENIYQNGKVIVFKVK